MVNIIFNKLPGIWSKYGYRLLSIPKEARALRQLSWYRQKNRKKIASNLLSMKHSCFPTDKENKKSTVEFKYYMRNML